MATDSHLVIRRGILYFGTPVVLLAPENPDCGSNLAPVSSGWALGQHLVLGLDSESQTVRTLAQRPQLVVDVASPELWEHMERLAPLTGPARCRRPNGPCTGTSAAASRRVRPATGGPGPLADAGRPAGVLIVSDVATAASRVLGLRGPGPVWADGPPAVDQ